MSTSSEAQENPQTVGSSASASASASAGPKRVISLRMMQLRNIILKRSEPKKTMSIPIEKLKGADRDTTQLVIGAPELKSDSLMINGAQFKRLSRKESFCKPSQLAPKTNDRDKTQAESRRRSSLANLSIIERDGELDTVASLPTIESTIDSFTFAFTNERLENCFTSEDSSSLERAGSRKSRLSSDLSRVKVRTSALRSPRVASIKETGSIQTPKKETLGEAFTTPISTPVSSWVDIKKQRVSLYAQRSRGKRRESFASPTPSRSDAQSKLDQLLISEPDFETEHDGESLTEVDEEREFIFENFEMEPWDTPESSAAPMTPPQRSTPLQSSPDREEMFDDLLMNGLNMRNFNGLPETPVSVRVPDSETSPSSIRERQIQRVYYEYGKHPGGDLDPTKKRIISSWRPDRLVSRATVRADTSEDSSEPMELISNDSSLSLEKATSSGEDLNQFFRDERIDEAQFRQFQARLHYQKVRAVYNNIPRIAGLPRFLPVTVEDVNDQVTTHGI